ncbi:MAG TPA: MFS transporter [Streptosporangiaceae bacterium]|nr:MFS transporter [Streptosporangiaceae bacterium]
MDAGGANRTATAEPVPLRRNRDFNLLWSGQAVSGLGSAVSGICYPLLILALTGSAAKAGIVSAAGLVTNLLLLLPAGVVADRYPRKRIMVITALAQMVAVGTVAPVTAAHRVYMAQLVGVGMVQGAASAFYIGASRGALRRVVPRPQLSQAFARTQARDQAVALAGAPAGGALFSLARFLPFACDSFSFGCIALATTFIRAPLDPDPAARAGQRTREPLRRSIAAGLRFVFGQPFLRTIAIWGAGVNSVVAGMSLMVIVLARQHGATPALIGLLLSVNAGAGMLGSLLAPRLTALAGGRRLALVASWLLPAGALALALAPSLWLIAVRGAVTSLLIAPVNVIFFAHQARVTPDHLQAQAGNAMQLCTSSFGWLTPPVFGLLADSLGVRAAIGVGAGLFALIALLVQFARHLDRLDEKAQDAE